MTNLYTSLNRYIITALTVKSTILVVMCSVLLLSTVMATSNYQTQDEGEVVVVSVDSTNLRFSPETITIFEGDSVRFFWSGELLAHNAVEENGLFDSGEPSRNVDYTYTFKIGENGTYTYVCEPHESLGMVGTIIVQPAPVEEEPPDEDPSSDIEENSETEDSEVPHVELGLVIAILLLIFQVIRIRSFGGTKLAETENQEEGLEAEILD